VGHVVALEPTSARRCGPKLQLMWQHVDACPASCLDLELVCRVPNLQGTDRGPRAHLERPCEPAGGANSLTPLSVILSFYLAVDGRAPGSAGAGGPGTPTINAKKHRRRGHLEVPKIKIQERPPSTLRNVDGRLSGCAGASDRGAPTINVRNVNDGPPGGAGAIVSGAPTINDKKRRRRAPKRCRSW
jgi:hypothetical protein